MAGRQLDADHGRRRQPAAILKLVCSAGRNIQGEGWIHENHVVSRTAGGPGLLQPAQGIGAHHFGMVHLEAGNGGAQALGQLVVTLDQGGLAGAA